MRNFTFGWLLSLLMITSFAFTTNAQTGNYVLDGTNISCDDYYSAGSDLTLNFTLTHVSTVGQWGEQEYLDSIALTFPMGFTPTAASGMLPLYWDPSNSVSANVNGQVVSWGPEASLAGTINFTVDVTIDASVTGTQLVNYFIRGDEASPNTDTIEATLNIEPLPSCLPVSDVQISEITPESVKVVWVKGDEETSWNVIYGAPGFNPESEGTTLVVTDTVTTIVGLSSETQYDVYVKADCGSGDLSPLSDVVTFTTQVSCPNPTAGAVHELTSTSATVKWVKGYQETAWKLVYGMGNFDPATAGTTVDNVTDTIYTIEGLNPETAYTFYIQANCEGESSELVWGGWFMTLATCPTPNSMLIGSKTTNSVSLSWTAGGEETTWNIIYGVQGFNVQTEGDTVEVTGTPTTTITGLEVGTSYEVYMQSNCGNGELSDAVWGTYFVTDCNAVLEFPFEEGFEGEYPVNCWSYVYAEDYNLANAMTHATEKDRTGAKSFRFSSWSSASAYDEYLISPELAMAEEMELSFWYAKPNTSNSNMEETFAVGVSTTTNEISAFTWGEDVVVPGDASDWVEFTQTLSADVKYVAIYYKSENKSYLYIDDFSIALPGEEPAIDLAILNPTGGMSCSYADMETVEVEVKNAGTQVIPAGTQFTFTMESEGTTVLTQEFTIDNALDPNATWTGTTTGMIDLSELGVVEFTASITQANDDNATNNSVVASYTTFEQIVGFQGAVNDTITTESLPYNIVSNVTINPVLENVTTSYLWNDGSTSSELSVNASGWYVLNVTTEGCETAGSVYVNSTVGVNEIETSDLSIYPNPTSGQFNLVLNSDLDSKVNIQVVNALGQVINNLTNVEANQTVTMDLSNEAEGVYYVRLFTNNQVLVKKVNVQK